MTHLVDVARAWWRQPWLFKVQSILWPALIVYALWGSGGCASYQPKTWTHPTAAQAEFKRDAYECERDVAYIPGHGVPAEQYRHAMFDRCLQARGWTPR